MSEWQEFGNVIAARARERKDFIMFMALTKMSFLDALLSVQNLMRKFAEESRWSEIVDSRIVLDNLREDCKLQTHIGLLDYYMVGLAHLTKKDSGDPDFLKQAELMVESVKFLLEIMSKTPGLDSNRKLSKTAAVLLSYGIRYAIIAYDTDDLKRARELMRKAFDHDQGKLPMTIGQEFTLVKYGLLCGIIIARGDISITRPRNLRALLRDIAELMKEEGGRVITTFPNRIVSGTFEVLVNSIISGQPPMTVVELLAPLFSPPLALDLHEQDLDLSGRPPGKHPVGLRAVG